jgi:hypothetical protein
MRARVIEQGLMLLIQSGLGSPPMVSGGFLDQLPENWMSTNEYGYMYRIISLPDAKDNHGLTFSVGFEKIRFEVNCYGATAAAKLTLARAVNTVLQGFQGFLPDPDETRVYCCMRSDIMDFPYDSSARNFRRMLEFEISYNNTF